MKLYSHFFGKASLLILIILVGFYFRTLVGLHWDSDQMLHPDERFLTMVTSSIELPSSFEEYFSSEKSRLSPYNKNYNFFVYGTFPIFLTKVLSVPVGMAEYGKVNIVGRVLSSIFDLLTVLVLYGIGTKLYERRVGLLAAGLLSVSVLNIQLSHFYGVETFVAFFIALTFYLSLNLYPIAERPVRKQILFVALSGIAFGLALASKVSAIFLAPIIALMFGYTPLLSLWNYGFRREGIIELLRRAALFLFFLVVAAVVFRIFQPYAFSGLFTLATKFRENMEEISRLMKGADSPPSIQWVNRTPILFPLKNMVLFEMGPFLGLASWFGIFVAASEIIRRRVLVHIAPVLWTLFFFLYIGSQFVKAGRYLSVVYPFFTLFAAYGLHQLTRYIHQKRRYPENDWISHIPSFICVSGTLLWAIAFTNIYRVPVTRVAASRWMFDNIPCEAVIGNETWDDALPLRIDGKDPYGGCYKGVDFNHYWPDDQKKLEDTLDKLGQADYIDLSSNRLYESIPRLPRRFPFTIYYYKMLFSGELGFDLVHTETSYPNIFGFQFSTDSAEEPFTVYDSPKVLIFKKAARFNINYVRERLSNFPPGVIEPLVEGH